MKKGDHEEQALFIIKEGQIDLIYENVKRKEEKSVTLKQQKTGDFFGELPFICESPYEESAISRSFSIVYKLNRNDFLEGLKSFPDDMVYI